MSLENLHFQLKHIYKGGVKSHRMDYILEILLQKAARDWSNRMIALIKDPATFRSREETTRHIAGGAMADEDLCMDSGNVLVKSQSIPDTWYEVRIIAACYVPGCHRCRICCVCMHMMTCSCDSYEHGQLCKHIHAAVIRFGDNIRPRLNPATKRKRTEEAIVSHADVTPYSPSATAKVDIMMRMMSPTQAKRAELAVLKVVQSTRSPSSPSSPSTRFPTTEKIKAQRFKRRRILEIQ